LLLPAFNHDQADKTYITTTRRADGTALLRAADVRTGRATGTLELTRTDAERLGFFLICGEDPPLRSEFDIRAPYEARPLPHHHKEPPTCLPDDTHQSPLPLQLRPSGPKTVSGKRAGTT
jgi:hypothetical protein